MSTVVKIFCCGSHHRWCHLCTCLFINLFSQTYLSCCWWVNTFCSLMKHSCSFISTWTIRLRVERRLMSESGEPLDSPDCSPIPPWFEGRHVTGKWLVTQKCPSCLWETELMCWKFLETKKLELYIYLHLDSAQETVERRLIGTPLPRIPQTQGGGASPANTCRELRRRKRRQAEHKVKGNMSNSAESLWIVDLNPIYLEKTDPGSGLQRPELTWGQPKIPQLFPQTGSRSWYKPWWVLWVCQMVVCSVSSGFVPVNCFSFGFGGFLVFLFLVL